MFVMFATPCLSAQVTVNYLVSLMRTQTLLQSMDVPNTYRVQEGICFIDHARNVLCHDFLKSEATDLFFIDDDIGWNPEAVLSLLEREEDIVGGVYTKKQDAVEFPIALLAENNKVVERDGLFLAQYLPTGFMRLKRSAVEKMAEGQPVYPDRRADGTISQVSNIFRTGYQDGERWGEDIDFARRWTAMGGTMWVDPKILLTHTGRKTWCVSFADAPRLTQEFLEGRTHADEKAQAGR